MLTLTTKLKYLKNINHAVRQFNPNINVYSPIKRQRFINYLQRGLVNVDIRLNQRYVPAGKLRGLRTTKAQASLHIRAV